MITHLVQIKMRSFFVSNCGRAPGIEGRRTAQLCPFCCLETIPLFRIPLLFGAGPVSRMLPQIFRFSSWSERARLRACSKPDVSGRACARARNPDILKSRHFQNTEIFKCRDLTYQDIDKDAKKCFFRNVSADRIDYVRI